MEKLPNFVENFSLLLKTIMSNTQKFPGRTSRNTAILNLLQDKRKPGAAPVVAGRVIGLIDGEGRVPGDTLNGPERGYILQDGTGKLELSCQGDLPEPGMIVEVTVKRAEGEQWEEVKRVTLADCSDFYISLQESPNYQRMIIDDQLRANLIMRSKVIGAIRDFFLEKEFIEVDTPCLVRLPGMEPYLDVFKTRFQADFSADQKIDEEMYLITSPEYAMKKLLVGGLEKIFQITKSFRNKETFSERHNPEFTILEWYRSYASYLEIMDDTEQLIKSVWSKFLERDHQGDLYSPRWPADYMYKPWRRLRVIDAFQELAGIDLATFTDLELFRAEVKGRGYAVSNEASFDDCFFTIFLNEIEPKLGFDVPVFLYDYPVSMAALSKPCADDSRFAERFELYIEGLELCNAFTELNDPIEQEKRLKIEREERKSLGKDLYDVDQTFVDALKFGMPPSGGNALGVDRLVMLMLGEKDIRRAMFFPHRDL